MSKTGIQDASEDSSTADSKGKQQQIPALRVRASKIYN
jgi:hypothetical protein